MRVTRIEERASKFSDNRTVAKTVTMKTTVLKSFMSGITIVPKVKLKLLFKI